MPYAITWCFRLIQQKLCPAEVLACGLLSFPDVETKREHQVQAVLLCACLWRQSPDPSAETYLIALHTRETALSFCDLWVYKEREEAEERKGCFLHWSRTDSLIQHWNNEAVSTPSPLALVGSFYFKSSSQDSVPAMCLAKEWRFWVDQWVQQREGILVTTRHNSTTERLASWRSPPAVDNCVSGLTHVSISYVLTAVACGDAVQGALLTPSLAQSS